MSKVPENIDQVEHVQKQLNQEEMISIADIMLARLEKQYEECQQNNIKTEVECPEDQGEGEEPEGYQVIGDGEDVTDMMSNEDQDEEDEAAGPKDMKNSEENKEGKQESTNKDIENGIGELVEVFPTEEWIPPERQININSQKIKKMSLEMKLQPPAWMKDDQLLKNRIFELFGPKK